MYINSKLDELLTKGYDNLTLSEITVLRCYAFQKEQDCNPFNVLLLNEFHVRSLQESNLMLDFMYKNGVKSFVISDKSTGLLAGLTYLLNSGTYTCSIEQGYAWNGRYDAEFGLLINIKRKRSR